MKPVEVFRINRDSVVVPSGQYDSIEFARYCNQPNIVMGIGPAEGVFTAGEFTRERIPVIRICNFTQSRSNFGEPIVDEQFIAIEPELRELLTIDERQQIENMKCAIADLEWYKQKQQRAIDDWWSKPWYSRVWSAIKGI